MLACSGCGAPADPGDPRPFRCTHAAPGDDVDHVMARRLDLARLPAFDYAPHLFVRWRTLLHGWHAAVHAGMADEVWCALVRELDERIAEVDGAGFRITPFARAARLSERLGFSREGGVWVKDETRGVAGSHKARHLMGVALWLVAMERLGRTSADTRPPLAIASCGNAALAAAVLSRALRWPLHVYVPREADPAILERLRALGAGVRTCGRRPGEPGDPCVHAFRRAVGEGAIPFGCQGSENGLAIEGGSTLAWEIAAALRQAAVVPDRLLVQVGGGALASACAQGLAEMRALGVLPRMPRIHAVQTRACAPLARAFDRATVRLREGLSRPALAREMATRRSEFMWPWSDPHGAASGILDDETYDWRAVVEAMLDTGGTAVVVEDEQVREAEGLGRELTDARPSPTGAAGLAGLLALRDRGEIGSGERVVVLFTGGWTG